MTKGNYYKGTKKTNSYFTYTILLESVKKVMINCNVSTNGKVKKQTNMAFIVLSASEIL